MAIDHEAHKIRIKAVSDRMNHPMEYNDAGAPKNTLDKITREVDAQSKKEMDQARYDIWHGKARFKNKK